MNRGNRKTAPRVKAGRVQFKNNRTSTGPCVLCPPSFPLIVRQRPIRGYRHLLQTYDIYRFAKLLPDYWELLHGLHTIFLGPGNPEEFGRHRAGEIVIHAWPRDLWIALSPAGFERERELLSLLMVPVEIGDDGVLCKFTEATARGHQLLGTFLHELGHHHDRMTTRSKWATARGEKYAYTYALEQGVPLFDAYAREFGL